MLVVRDDRRVIEVRGEDRVAFLDATLSQRIDGRDVGDVVGALWLDIHGATLAAMDLVVGVDHLVLVTSEAHAPAILEKLAMRTFLSDATFSATDHHVVAVRGELADALPAWSSRRDGEVVVIGRPGGVDLVGAQADVAAWLAGEALPQPSDDLTALSDEEVRRGIPRAPAEIAGQALPEELGLLPTHVHLAKGCYPGQEAVARMWMLGKPRRRLVVVELDGVRPSPGDEVGTSRERWTLTRVTAAAVDGHDHALAFAPGATVIGDVVAAEDWSGRVVALVGDGGDQPGADPRVTRRRDRPAGERGNRLPNR